MKTAPHASLEPAGPNAEMIRYWNQDAGPRWIHRQEQITAQIRPHGQRALDRAGIAPGDHVLDVGCGAGETTLEIARRVGARGRAVGLDISTGMLAQARAAAEAAALANVAFENVDAQVAELPEGAFDALYSRFGVMFFIDTEAAFRNLRRALKAGARLSFVCWRSLEENPWMRAPFAAAAQHIPLKRPPPGAPGPFALADGARLRETLERAGFEVAIDPLDEPMTLGGGSGLDAAVELALELGPMQAAMAEAGPAERDAVARAIREAFAPYATAEGVRIPAAAWLVSGRAR
jgi:SAM-dependent methyltransferase